MAKLTVLGLGNILMQDEGVGVRVMEAVRDSRDWPDTIEFIDGGAGGMNLINVLEAAEKLVVFDSAEMKLDPGEYRVIAPQQVRGPAPEHRATMHDVPFIEALTLVGRFLHRPQDVKILAIQPDSTGYGRGLSDRLEAAMGSIVQAAVELLESEARLVDCRQGPKDNPREV
ncbi:MAG: hydrogenase maturation protease [Planctomycetota bacterium]|jgi:hydrogenase maturation protease